MKDQQINAIQFQRYEIVFIEKLKKIKKFKIA